MKNNQEFLDKVGRFWRDVVNQEDIADKNSKDNQVQQNEKPSGTYQQYLEDKSSKEFKKSIRKLD